MGHKRTHFLKLTFSIYFAFLFFISYSQIEDKKINYYSFAIERHLKINDYKSLYIFTKNLNLKKNYKKINIYNSLFLTLSLANINKINEARIKNIEIEKFLYNKAQYNAFKNINIGIKGIISYRMGYYTDCIKDIDKATRFLSEYKQKNKLDFYLLAFFYRFLGRAYSETGIYLQGISYIKKSNIIFNKLNNKENTYINLKYIGRIYQLSKKYDEAFESFALMNYKRALQGFKKYNMADEIPWIYTIIADYYLIKEKPFEAKMYQDSAFYIIKKNDYLLLGLANNNYGKILELNKRYIKAKEKYLNAIHLYSKIGNTSNKAVSYNNLADISIETNNFKLAIQYTDSSLLYAKKSFNSDKIFKANLLYYKIYKHIKNYKLAFKYLEKAYFLSDSIFTEKNYEKAYSYKTFYETKQKERENQELLLVNKIKEKEIIKQKRKINIILGTVVILLIFLTLFLLLIRARNKIEEEKNKFKLIIEGQEIEKQRIAKELHDGIASELTGVKYKLSNVTGINARQIESHIDKLHKDIRNLSHDLYNHSKNINLPNIINTHLKRVNSKSIKFTFINDTDIDWKKININIQNNLYRIVQETINNIIKHSEASLAEIQLLKIDHELILIIEDNGKGFDKGKQNIGIGLSNIKSRTEAINGKLQIDTNIGNGTILTISIKTI